MALIIIIALAALALSAVVPQFPLDPSDNIDCNITLRERKTLNWDFLPTPDTSKPHSVNRYDLIAPGAGFVWREEAYYHPDVTRPILFQSTQGWSVVNCSSYFAPDDPVRNGCTSPHLALLSSPNTKPGDSPPDKGKIGTIKGSKYPEFSLWAVYDLIEFRLTPIVPSKYYQESITVEVFGWRENGTITTTMRFKIKGSEVGYRVELPKGGWDTIIQWQVRVWWSAGNRSTREDFKYLIDDVIIDEYALRPNNPSCRYPAQAPRGPPGPVVTLGFDDIPTPSNPGAVTLPPRPYQDFIFDQGYGSWKVINQLSYPPGSPGRLISASTGSNALLATPKKTGTWSHDPNVITTTDFLFDVESFHISVDSTTTETDNPRDILVVISAVGACFLSFVNPYEEGSYAIIEFPSYSFDVDLTKRDFKKFRAVSIYVMDYGSFRYIPFWIDNIKVRSQKGVLDFPGCERCGADMEWWCEYPPQVRALPTTDGGWA